MKFAQYLPPDELKNYVRCFWTMECDAADTSIKSFKTLADGCPGMIFQQTENPAFHQKGKKLPKLFLYGQSTGCSTLSSPGSFRLLGVYFHPHALKSVFGYDAMELTNGCLDLSTEKKWADDLGPQLAEINGVHQQIEFLSVRLHQLIQNNRHKNSQAVNYAVAQIIQTNGAVDLPSIHNYLQISERSFERHFKRDIGISPKLFSRICRFQSSLEQLKNSPEQKLTDLAYENSYADQSHFIRTFKEFTGLSPMQYVKNTAERITNFPEMV